MKKITNSLFTIGLCLTLMSGCGVKESKNDTQVIEDLTSIVTSPSSVEDNIVDTSKIETPSAMSYELDSDIKRTDVLTTYKDIFDSYFRNGFSRKLDEDFFYKGIVIAGLSGENDKEYMCYTIKYKNNGVEKDFVIPSQEMSNLWLNEIFINLINRNTEDLILEKTNDIKKLKGVRVLRVYLDGLYRDVNILNNPYGTNLNDFTWGSVSVYNMDVIVEVKAVAVGKKTKDEVIESYASKLTKGLEDYNLNIIVEEY